MKKSLTERDQRVIWHPYTQHKNILPPIPVVRGKGTLLFDDQDKPYIDAISSWWVNIHGHSHPHIAEKIYLQAQTLEHVIFTGFTHEPAVLLAERLLPILPGDFSRIFYSDNGSTAVEVAIKMAIQFWGNLDPAPPKKRTKVLAFRNSYHGDTFGAMSVSERSVFTDPFSHLLFEVVFVDTPNISNLQSLLAFIDLHAEELACCIYEPLLQAAGGMHIYEAGPMDSFLSALKRHDIICIADEVLTGFGRTGKLFAGEYLSQKADVICCSKGLTGGTMALGVTAATERIFNAFLSDDKRKTLFHGHSFTANPIACSASLASLDLLLDPGCLERIRSINASHKTFADRIRSKPLVRNIRIIGTVIAFEIVSGTDGYINALGADMTRKALDSGIYLRPLGNTVYFMPPYCITEKEKDQVYKFLVRYIDGMAIKN